MHVLPISPVEIKPAARWKEAMLVLGINLGDDVEVNVSIIMHHSTSRLTNLTQTRQSSDRRLPAPLPVLDN